MLAVSDGEEGEGEEGEGVGEEGVVGSELESLDNLPQQIKKQSSMVRVRVRVRACASEWCACMCV